jgi:hypothetical protein
MLLGSPYLPLEIQMELVLHSLEMENKFYDLTGQDLRSMAFKLTTKNNIKANFLTPDERHTENN